ncbi:ISL3 family transposase [Candidatus Poriferisodalis sp.]|uniref:ISL3 family transposase n=1 Tax=Candidatus Poriferisodalis sp. TaxID=3101277 RepID=UPI003B010DD7
MSVRAAPRRAAARRHRVGWHTAMALVIAYAGLVGDHRRRRRCGVLWVDETSIRERRRHVTVLVNGDTAKTLAVVAHRSEAALSGFPAAQSHRRQKASRSSCPTGRCPMRRRPLNGSATPAASRGRFHVVRWLAAAPTAARRDVQRRPQGSRPAFDPDAFRARFALTKRPDTLDATERARLNGLFTAHPRLKTAWDTLSEQHQLHPAKDREGALETLHRFADIHSSGHTPELNSTVDTFLARHTQILDRHHTRRPSNEPIEDTNNLHPSPATQSPQLHQPHQLRNPRHPHHPT